MPPSWKRTLDDVSGDWDWPSTWEWDYPNGHNLQSHRMPLYLPGNGGLLYAATLMAASWGRGAPHDGPGFRRTGDGE